MLAESVCPRRCQFCPLLNANPHVVEATFELAYTTGELGHRTLTQMNTYDRC